MKSTGKWSVLLAVMLFGAFNARAAGSDEAVLEGLDAERREAAKARAKDAAWQPATREVALIQVGKSGQPGALRNYCLNKEGNILAAWAPHVGSPAIRVYSPEGKLLKTLPVEIKPGAICVAQDDSIFVAGEGRILKLDPAGKVLASTASPVANEKVVLSKETEEMVREMCKESRQPFKEEFERMKDAIEKRRADVSGVAVTGDDVFMAVPSPNDFTYRVYRFTSHLESPKLVVEKLRGCCGQMDVQAHDGKIWIPHNARHAVETLDRDGKQIAKFGKAGKVKPSDFGGCCEPKCIRVLPNGDILAAESGPPTAIKRFSADGKFKEVVALVENVKGDCVRVTVEASPDGQKFYMLDTTRDAIRVFAKR